MTVMITSKAKVFQIITLVLSVVIIGAFLLIKFPRHVISLSSGSTYEYTEYLSILDYITKYFFYGYFYGAQLVFRGIPMLLLALITIFSATAKRIPNLIISILYFLFSGTIFLTYGVGGISIIAVVFATFVLVISILSLADKSKDFSNSIYIEQEEVSLGIVYTVSILVAYYFMNLPSQYFSFNGQIMNYFAAFSDLYSESSILHAIIAIAIIICLFLLWKNKRIPFFIINMALSLLLVVLFFKHIGMPYRIFPFYIVTLCVVAETIISIILFKKSLKPSRAKVDADNARKQAEIELLKSVGKYSESTSQPQPFSSENKVQSVGNNSFSEADELKKFKKLLDEGIITQEEFDTKKKQIFNCYNKNSTSS